MNLPYADEDGRVLEIGTREDPGHTLLRAPAGGLGADRVEPCGSQPAQALHPEMAAPRIERIGRWPGKDEPGRVVACCSCRRWSCTGTAAEIAAASRGHDDSPWRHHIVHIWGKVLAP